MTLTFDVLEEGGGYTLRTHRDGTHIEVRASENELRRLLIDLHHTLDYDGMPRVPEEPEGDDAE